MSQNFYDELGRVYKTQRHKIDTADGSDDDNLVALTWYDEQGRVIMVDGEELSKTFYDRLGRVTHRFTLASVDSTEYNSGSYGTYSRAKDVASDFVLLERQTTYESSDSDDVVMDAVVSRHHDDLSTGTTGALDTNADTDELLYTATNVEGRIQIRARWYDDEGRGRVTTEVNYGTYGGSNFDRDGLTEPSRSDTALRTDYAYNTDGTLLSVTDPRDLETRYEYDDSGRQVTVIRNYVNGTPSGVTGDDDVHTRTEYTDGLRKKLWVDFDGDGTVDTGDQDTIYTFGTSKGASAGDSKIGTGHLLQKIQYPDSSGGSDVVTFAYNAQGQQIYKKDQAGNVIEAEYDESGREEHRRVTTLGADFDGDVRRISTTYDDLGRRELITQYDNATVGNGSVTDEVKYTYEGWGSISKIEQDNNSAVASSGGDEYEISYTYEKKQAIGRNTIRRVNFVAPSGNTFDHEYRSVGDRFDDDCSRVTHIDDGATLLALYSYNGVGQVVGIDYSGIDIAMTRAGGGGYDRLDRFNRVQDDIWTADGGTATDFYDLHINYDRNGNIVDTEDDVHVGFDVKYTIDGLDRLTGAQEGTLSGGSISSETREQTWNLDQVGNWEDVTLDLNGDGDYADTDEYDDDREHNDVNEITTRDTNDDETVDYTLSFDEAGNLTDDAEEYEYVYDAFYRLREVSDQSHDLVAEHRYNGLGHRIAEHADTDDDGDVDANDEWHHFCYDERWRVTAMFVDSDTAPAEEFMHHGAGDSGFGGATYIDEVAVRDRDTDHNGSLEERGFYCQNGRHDVVAMVDSVGHQLEMVRYLAYGIPFGLPRGDADSDGDCDSGDAADTSQIQSWITSGYDVRGDLDLDGDVEGDDKSSALANKGALGGLSTLSWQGSHLGRNGAHMGGARDVST
ncbi:MAG: RHS repeat protein [bacterium]|nr:RHS repeat protein [bacterium]